ncbi:MAG: FAD-dependent oxidoreductase [Thermodesulfobacteriota bacterium]
MRVAASRPKDENRVLVVGAGIAGLRAALDLAESGGRVTLIDRAPHLGGILARLDYQYPTNRCGLCRLLPLVDRDASSQHCLRRGLFHENIELVLPAELAAVEGAAGDFTATVLRPPALVDPDLCVGCGLCEEACPVEVPDDFNLGLARRKAVYLPTPHLFPNRYVIDRAACTLCGECARVCPTGAVDLAAAGKDFRVLVVDDELIMRDSLKEWLAAEGFPADMAASGPEALAMIGAAAYDLMLLDIKMPGMDGVEVLKKAKQAAPDLVIVMMTAYATVETAVEAMKIGALNYLVKPFNPEDLMPLVEGMYRDKEAAKGLKVQAGAIVLAGGASFYDPGLPPNLYGYGVRPGVVTGLEFERILSPAGPTGGRLVRPGDGRPIRKAAWLQCVGSRSPRQEADFCSSICCMHSIKEAWLARDRSGGDLEAVIFYMDLRTYGQGFQRYRDRAERERGIRFERSRVHTVLADAATEGLRIGWVRPDGQAMSEDFDLVVLALGQRPGVESGKIAEMLGLGLNPWGFPAPRPLAPARADREGVFLAGSASGLRDISESVIQGSSAALCAARVIRAAGGAVPGVEAGAGPEARDVSREAPLVRVLLCTCGGRLTGRLEVGRIEEALAGDPEIEGVRFLERACTVQGWEEMKGAAAAGRFNRVLVGGCAPLAYGARVRELARLSGLPAGLVTAVGLLDQAFFTGNGTSAEDLLAALDMALAALKQADPEPPPQVRVTQRALVVGGGAAGLTAALALADLGCPVELVEQAEILGGNLLWLAKTLEGHDLKEFLAGLRAAVEKHPLVNVRAGTRVVGSAGGVGRFLTTVQRGEEAPETIEHGAVILATGGQEATPTEYGYGRLPAVLTQMEMERRLEAGEIGTGRLADVVMIQCVGSREEPRNYCSRVCCPGALKQALRLKAENAGLNVFVLYRDMMTYGFTESYYTQAREAGVVFIPYTLDRKPEVGPAGDKAAVTVLDPTLGRPVSIEADLVVLATGVVPSLPAGLAEAFGAGLDQDGFFQEADEKWRPVDSLTEGVFACGLALSPRGVAEAVATAEAAAQRAYRILSRKAVPSGRVVARVRSSYCSLCQACLEACPYGARRVDPEEERVVVDPARCQGCGVCAAVCPNSAAVVSGFTDRRFFNVIDAALKGAWWS